MDKESFKENSKMRTAWQMAINECARIDTLSEHPANAPLMELGCLPGSEIQMLRRTSFGGPVYLKINGIFIALRKEEANLIFIK